MGIKRNNVLNALMKITVRFNGTVYERLKNTTKGEVLKYYTMPIDKSKMITYALIGIIIICSIILFILIII